jgi:hypothetical protein
LFSISSIVGFPGKRLRLLKVPDIELQVPLILHALKHSYFDFNSLTLFAKEMSYFSSISYSNKEVLEDGRLCPGNEYLILHYYNSVYTEFLFQLRNLSYLFRKLSQEDKKRLRRSSISFLVQFDITLCRLLNELENRDQYLQYLDFCKKYLKQDPIVSKDLNMITCMSSAFYKARVLVEDIFDFYPEQDFNSDEYKKKRLEYKEKQFQAKNSISSIIFPSESVNENESSYNLIEVSKDLINGLKIYFRKDNKTLIGHYWRRESFKPPKGKSIKSEDISKILKEISTDENLKEMLRVKALAFSDYYGASVKDINQKKFHPEYYKELFQKHPEKEWITREVGNISLEELCIQLGKRLVAKKSLPYTYPISFPN